ncbi:MAG: hypothetical protein KG003_02980 [Bacteroidetes bacterium]|nr:hypothetical protein [Bacteroidota bacterium]
METKIQLKHPLGKKAISMDQNKYKVLKNAILECLKINGATTHKEMLKAVNEYFNRNKMKFEGSVEWHMEWVKLDLEAGKKIKRIAGQTPLKFELY